MDAHEFMGMVLAFAFGATTGIFMVAWIHRVALAQYAVGQLKIAELRSKVSILEADLFGEDYD